MQHVEHIITVVFYGVQVLSVVERKFKMLYKTCVQEIRCLKSTL